MRWDAGWVVNWPWLWIVLFLSVTLGMATNLPRLEIDPEVKNQLPEDMPARLDIRQIEDVFGGTEMLMVVLESDNVLEGATLERAQRISEDLDALDEVDKVVGLFSLTDIRGEDGLMLVEDAVEDLPQNPDESVALGSRLEGNDLVFGNVVSKDFKGLATIALLRTEVSDAESTAAVHRVLEAHPGPERTLVGGMPEIRTHVSADIRSDMRRFMPIGLLIILTFLYACFRQVRGVVLPFLVVVMSVVVAVSLIPVFGWKVQMVTVVMPVILLAVANDYGIHLMARYQEENVPGNDRTPKVMARKVLEDLGGPVAAAGFTTMAGLLCLLTHIVVPAQQLGVLASIGVLFALLASVFFIPSVLAVLPPSPPLAALTGEGKRSSLEHGLRSLAESVVARPKAWIGGILITAALATSGIVRLEVDTNPVNYYPSSDDVAQTANSINEHFGGSTEMSVMFEGDVKDPAVLNAIDGLEQHLQALPEVGYTTSVAGVVRKMNQAVMGGDASENRIPDTRAAVAQYFLLYSMGGDPTDFERIVDFDYAHALVTARIRSMSTSDTAAVVASTEAWIRDNGLQGSVTLGGFGPLFVDLVDAVVQGQLYSLGLSIVFVFILVGALFRSPAAGFWAAVPLCVAIPVLFGLMGAFGIELNVVTAMLSSIMIGVGVDYTIHFLWRYREVRRRGASPGDGVVETLTTTGRGIVFNALSVIAGFAVLLISNFLPVKFFGFLVVVCISACLAGALVLLPSFCLVVRPGFLEPPPQPKVAKTDEDDDEVATGSN